MAPATVAAQDDVAGADVPYRRAVEVAVGRGGPGGQAALIGSIRLREPLLLSVGVGIRTYETAPPFSDDLVAPTYLAALRLQRRVGSGLFAGVGLGFSTGADWEEAVPLPGVSNAFWSWKLRHRVDASVALEWDFVPIFLRLEAGVSGVLNAPLGCVSCALDARQPSQWIPFFGLAVGHGAGRAGDTALSGGNGDSDELTDRALVTPTALTLSPGTFRIDVIDVLGAGFTYAPVSRIEVGATFLLPLFQNYQVAQALVKARLVSVGPVHLALVGGGWYFHADSLASELWGGGALASLVVTRVVLTAGVVVGRVFQDQDEGHRYRNTRTAFLSSALVRVAPALSLLGELWTDLADVEGGLGFRLHLSRCGGDLGLLFNADALLPRLPTVPWLRVGCRL